MAEKRINIRIKNKHATEAVWHNEKNSGFVPYIGELIIYDIDDSYPVQRIKIGDGKTPIIDLPFISTNSNNTAMQIGGTKPEFACTWFKVKS